MVPSIIYHCNAVPVLRPLRTHSIVQILTNASLILAYNLDLVRSPIPGDHLDHNNPQFENAFRKRCRR